MQSLMRFARSTALRPMTDGFAAAAVAAAGFAASRGARRIAASTGQQEAPGTTSGPDPPSSASALPPGLLHETKIEQGVQGRDGNRTKEPTTGLNAFVDPIRFLGGTHDPGRTTVGREWEARELRLKSFDDLHGLWYVLLREKNMLQTEKFLAKANRTKMRAMHRIGKVNLPLSPSPAQPPQSQVIYTYLAASIVDPAHVNPEPYALKVEP